jgi:hypothetical protein
VPIYKSQNPACNESQEIIKAFILTFYIKLMSDKLLVLMNNEQYLYNMSVLKIYSGGWKKVTEKLATISLLISGQEKELLTVLAFQSVVSELSA